EAGKARIAPAGRSSRPDASVGGVELADHLRHHVMQFVLVGDIQHQWLVLRTLLIPADAMESGIIKTMLHYAPGLLENLPALGAVVHLDSSSELDPFRLAGRPRAATPWGRGGRWPGRSGNGVNSLGLTEIERFAVLAELQRVITAARARGGI